MAPHPHSTKLAPLLGLLVLAAVTSAQPDGGAPGEHTLEAMTLDPTEQKFLDSVGWAVKSSPLRAKNVTDTYIETYGKFGQKLATPLPVNAKDYIYMLLPGLFTKHYPFYFQCNRAALEGEKYGHDLKVTMFEIDTDQPASVNAPLIRDQILAAAGQYLGFEGRKGIIVISHSKGGSDMTDVLTMYPEVHDYVKGHVALQSAFGGSIVASELAYPEAGAKLLVAAVKLILKGDPEAVLNLTYDERTEDLKEHPYTKAAAVPTISLATHTSRVTSLMAPVVGAMHYKFGQSLETDGLVATLDSIIPGSMFVHVGDVDHGDTVFDQLSYATYQCKPSLLSLVSLLLQTLP